MRAITLIDVEPNDLDLYVCDAYNVLVVFIQDKHMQPDINFRSDEAVYIQIADHFTRQIALCRLHPGDRLPAIRKLAQRLNVDPGTVARAYQELEREGIITSHRGGGSLVSTSASEKYLAEQQLKRLGTLVERTILEALGLGFTTEDIEAAFTLHLAEWRELRAQSSDKKGTTDSRQANEIRFFGSHDLAVELLASHLGTLYQGVRFSTSFVGSLVGLVALECGEADIAGTHLMDNDTGEFNIPFVRRLIPNETIILMNLVQRVQGLMLAPGNPKRITGIPDLRRPNVTFVNRQKGSGTRILLDSQLLSLGIPPAEIRGYEHEEKTHIAVATIVAQGHADVGLGAQSAADVAGLDFIPLLKERYDLVTLQRDFDRLQLQRIQQLVQSEGFLKMLRSMPGYDLSETGNTRIISPGQN